MFRQQKQGMPCILIEDKICDQAGKAGCTWCEFVYTECTGCGSCSVGACECDAWL